MCDGRNAIDLRSGGRVVFTSGTDDGPIRSFSTALKAHDVGYACMDWADIVHTIYYYRSRSRSLRRRLVANALNHLAHLQRPIQSVPRLFHRAIAAVRSIRNAHYAEDDFEAINLSVCGTKQGIESH